MASERQADATAFLKRALAFFAAHGVAVARVMTDKRPPGGRAVSGGACALRRARGSASRSHLFHQGLTAAGCRPLRTRPDTPRTNGKAERFIQTSLRERADARAYPTSNARTQAMQPWISRYNQLRPHAALSGQPPISRLNNVLGFDS
jgi:transposase InsO family protein